ncbi:MAG: hypothetical protein Ct9H300mP7_1680 [Verrucomicrobiota bacterium]|nr:MAG: hypothetical protein Ct9H300mP7_1680 [Verrucomicrobiota bacterium]
MIGELNVRNALAALLLARYTGLSDEQIQSGFDTFKGIQRRLEIRGETGGIIVIDDFAHHPTAIRETLKALGQRYPGRRVWAIFEPRSNTTRRNHFQSELAEALSLAKRVVVAEIARLEQVPEGERLDPARLMEDIRTAGTKADYLRLQTKSSPTSPSKPNPGTSSACSAMVVSATSTKSCWPPWPSEALKNCRP